MIQADVIGNTLSLKKAVLFYGNNQGEAYASVHPVHMNGPVPEIQAGVPLNEEALEEMIQALANGANRQPFHFIDSSVVVAGTSTLAWYTKSQTRHMFFHEKLEGLTSGLASQPALLWVRTKEALYLYALASDERPGPETPLFECPHFNIWRDGKACLGSSIKTDFADTQGAMDSYWRAVFTHRNDQHMWKQTTHRRGLNALWALVLKQKGRKPFPVQYLKPIMASKSQPLTVQSALALISKSE